MAATENKFLFSKSLWAQLSLIATLVSCTIFGVKFVVSEMKEVVKTEIAALIKKVEEHEDKIEKLESLLAVNTTRTDAVYLSANVFIDSYNRTYHREFLRPVDITTESIITDNKKRKK